MPTTLRRVAFLLLTLSFYAQAQPVLTVIHPAEGSTLPNIKAVFVFGEVTPGSTLTINGSMIKVHPKGGYLVMIPVQPGAVLLSCEATTPQGDLLKVERHFTIASGFIEAPLNPLTLLKETLEPSEDIILMPGDPLRVSFQGSSQATADFSISEKIRRIPIAERMAVPTATDTAHGLYEGTYTIQPDDVANRLPLEIQFKSGKKALRIKTKGRLTIDNGALIKTGLITDDVVAVRTGPGAGYDLFLYKGMRVRLTGKYKNERRIRLSSLQSGWIKESAVQELPAGSPAPRSYLGNMIMARQEDSTLIRIPLETVLPYRTEQNLDPMQLVVTLYGAIDKTDLIRYDPKDTLIRQIRWKQVGPDMCQVIVEPTFKKWWGYDVRYEGSTLVIEVRKPWLRTDVKGMVIALDPGHGGSEWGATGPHATLEKECNLAIARVVRNALVAAGAQVIMTRDNDIDVPLYERSRIAWQNRAQLFISIHSNASGEGEDPLTANGSSVYWYHPQSVGLARAVHAQYGPNLRLPDRGLFYSDFAVCRMTQMPAILTEQAYLIVPEQELLLFNPDFQQSIARALLTGIKNFIKPPPQ